MAVTGFWYGLGLKAILNKEVDVDSDTLKIMLMTSSYTPDLAAHDYKNDVTNEVTGTGYTAGGATLASPSLAYVAANSWATARANSTAYVAGQVVRPATGNGFLYQAITGGTSGGSVPTYPTTIGGTVTDGGVTWMCVAKGALVFDATDTVWSSSSITGARYAAIYDSTPGSDATRPLLVLLDFGGDQTSSSGNFTITYDATGICYLLIP